MTTSVHMVDIAFRVHGLRIPADHGYPLFAAISQNLPYVHQNEQASDSRTVGREPSDCADPIQPVDVSYPRLRCAERSEHRR